MRIESIRIQNLRAFKDETLGFDDYTCLIGPNGSGKSTVLTALNIFFRENEGSATNLLTLEEEDFHGKDTCAPIEITLVFADLTDEAKEEFADYFRAGKLIVKSVAIWDPNTSKAEVKQHGVRLGMAEFAPFFSQEGAGARVADLQEIYADLNKSFPELPRVTVKQQMIDALHAFERAHPSRLVELMSHDQFYGFTKGANRLAKYVQWVFVPAVKDASQEQRESKDSALEKLLNRTVRSKVNFTDEVARIRNDARTQYAHLLADSQAILRDVSESLSKAIGGYTSYPVHTSVRWTEDQAKSVQVNEPFATILAGDTARLLHQIARCGHGMQRCFLIALLNELAMLDGSDGPKLILGIEEPELYQHPPQARHLATVLRKLAASGSQVIACTHSPYFVSGEFFEEIRLVLRDPLTCSSSIHSTNFEAVSDDLAKAYGSKQPWHRSTLQAKLNQELLPELNEVFFTPLAVLVEGPEDAALLTTHMVVTEQWDEFRMLGGHVIPCGGKYGLVRPLAIANRLSIPHYVLFDADGNLNGTDREKAELASKAILTLVGRPDLAPFPSEPIVVPQVALFPRDLKAAVKADLGEDEWNRWWEEVLKEFDPGAEMKKTSIPLSKTIEMAHEAGAHSETLEKVSQTLITLARDQWEAKTEAREEAKS